MTTVEGRLDGGEASVLGCSLRHTLHTAGKPSWQGQQLQKEKV